MVKLPGCMRILSTFSDISLGVTVFTLDPYQIGYENEEGIESGSLLVLSQAWISSHQFRADEARHERGKKIATRSGYRTWPEHFVSWLKVQ